MKGIVLLLTLIFTTLLSSNAQKKSKGKGKKEPEQVNFAPEKPEAVPDTAKKFIGVIKYRMTSDDPSDKDSIFIVFGETQIRIIMFIPGYREDQVFERSMIANLKDSTFFELDARNKTYSVEKLALRNEGTELSVAPTKKHMQILNFSCPEYKGEMTTVDGEVAEASCLLSNQHYFNAAADYTFLGIHPLVMSYKIVLGFRTKSSENENTYIMAYKIEPGNTAAYFDLSQYKTK
ncbi:MAG: hypothetical protein V9F01_12955 [Chitinophagaceae bacterium]